MSEGALHFHAYIRFNKIITLYERYRISFSFKRKYKNSPSEMILTHCDHL